MDCGGIAALVLEEAVDGGVTLLGPRLRPREVARALMDELTLVAKIHEHKG
jgi:hypothetical protein